MAADTYEAQSYKAPARFSRDNSGPIVRKYTVDTDTLTGAAGSTIASGLLELNDVIKFFKLPPDVKILWGRVALEKFDSATSLEWALRVTNGTTTKYIFQGATAGRSAGAVDSRAYSGGTGAMHEFSTDSAIGYVVPGDDFYVDFKVTAAPAGASTGDQINVEVAYTSALEQDEAQFRS